MRVTRRYWVTVSLIGALALWAVILERPLPLLGAAGIASWLLVQQYQFIRTVKATVSELTVTQQVDRTRVTANETTLGTLSVQTDERGSLSLTAATEPPTGADGDRVSCLLAGTDQTAQVTFEVTWPVAGEFEFTMPTIGMTDDLGLFEQTTTVGNAPTVTVEPRTPQEIHIGEGGNRVASGFGEHETKQTGGGLSPAEVRKYVPGDNIRRIDWKATARLNEPHIREFEAETDLETMLLVDHRAVMGDGQDGETKLDFARQVALAISENAQRLADPFGCYTVGDGGLTNTFDPSTNDDRYRAIAQSLRTLRPTDGPATNERGDIVEPAAARRTATHLSMDDPFSTRLRPFFENSTTYVRRVAEKPLFAAVQTASTHLSGTVRTIIVTDDTHRTELREAVKVARRNAGQVVVFLTPSVLYEAETLPDVEEAYRQYTDFEEFRRELAALGHVTAFEVGPRDRLSRVLATGKQQRRAQR
ncbi:DUF58 domain-containing protein [Haloarcula nitratireducens]|uniref:DUF58 domain-containing protein n=1 Tax=Haloarcula nitratireducens TaxID=2487749 RepID=A0AAW4PKH7_9EURY|nr:DUF58 domain-containing protein [Halomicroarcula nitratireducens]MBX0297800.1 DUF58 domain-containing protein [Halomicroarcula nitratireducens]